MSASKITLGPEQVSTDRYGRKTFARAVKVGGVVQGVIIAEPTHRNGKPGYDLCGMGATVTTLRDEAKGDSFLNKDHAYYGFSSRGPAPEWDHQPAAEEIADNALAYAAYNDGFGWAKYAEEGSAVPAGVHPAFFDGVKGFQARYDGARPLVDGKITGKAWS